MLNHELACDVEFAVGLNGDIVRAHKYMLVSRSPVFFAMFYGSLAVHHNAPHIIPDISPDAFRSMLQLVHQFVVFVERFPVVRMKVKMYDMLNIGPE